MSSTSSKAPSDGPPTASPERPTLGQILAAARLPALYLNGMIHLFILIPATAVIAWLATRLDAVLGWAPVFESPTNWILFGLFFPIGIIIVWLVYGYLAILGHGSPGTHLGGTETLVTTGIFRLCRHPSIIGKFVGVVAFGFLVASPVFLFIIIPLLTTWSLVSVRFWQERRCEELWGDDYREYRRRTPSVVPRLRDVWEFLREWRSKAGR